MSESAPPTWKRTRRGNQHIRGKTASATAYLDRETGRYRYIINFARAVGGGQLHSSLLFDSVEDAMRSATNGARIELRRRRRVQSSALGRDE